MEANITIEPDVFNSAYLKHIENHSRIQIYFGGSGSGKSKFLAQRKVYWVLNGGRNILICRQVGRTVRKSVFNEIVKVIREWNITELFTINKTDGAITCKNGYQIIFTGLDDTEKIKSITPEKGVITDIWIEEATETERTTIRDLLKRQRGGDEKTKKTLTLSFNPILQSHWIYQEYFAGIAWADNQTEYKSDDLTILKTWYIHNRFLTPDDIKDLESETDEYYRNVYTFGNWGILGDVIFKNWHIQDLAPMMAQFTNHRAGLDFGFSSDPAAMPIMHYDAMRKTVYIYDEFYERGLTNQELAKEITDRIGDKPITCDSAEPKSIRELRDAGVNALAAKKGKDSVNFGIQWLQQQTIIIHSECVNAKREFSTYHWKKDKDGNALRIPAGKDDDLIDGTRYGLENDMEESRLQWENNGSDKVDDYRPRWA